MFESNSPPTRAEQAAALALVQQTKGEWRRTAEVIEASRSALRIIDGDWTGFEPVDVTESTLVRSVDRDELAKYEEMIGAYEERGVRLLTVLDADYPKNLRLVYNRPPFLWVWC